MRDLLKDYVINDLFKDSDIKPSRVNSAFFPTDRTIENHMYIAATREKLSCIDQVNLAEKVKDWRKEDPNRKFFFRPYKLVKGGEEHLEDDIKKYTRSKDSNGEFNPHHVKSKQFEEKLLYVHQEKWQRDLLNRYRNNICLMDATYRTTKYVLPLFFVIVNTNAGYKVVGT